METQLALTRSIATRIVKTVAADALCKQRIPRSYPLGDAGLAGSLRNLANPWMFVIPNYQPTEKESAEACTGIAEATALAINARAKREPSFPVKIAETVDRISPILGVFHTATKVTLRSGESFVFDWHATLTIHNPMIHPSVQSWTSDLDGILFSQWTGRMYSRFCAERK